MCAFLAIFAYLHHVAASVAVIDSTATRALGGSTRRALLSWFSLNARYLLNFMEGPHATRCSYPQIVKNASFCS